MAPDLSGDTHRSPERCMGNPHRWATSTQEIRCLMSEISYMALTRQNVDNIAADTMKPSEVVGIGKIRTGQPVTNVRRIAVQSFS